MFDILFGWRKASKCKTLIKHVQCRLKLLKNKRCTIVRQLREDVAELIKHGHEDKAFNRVEEIINDDCIVALYELLDHYCEFILIHFPYIRRHKDCPNDINEAVSSLIYASARCGDLPELRVIRKLFGDRYGQKFLVTALELLTGNLVNPQVIEKFSHKPVTDDMKHRLVNEIARNYCIKPEVLAIEYYSEWQQKEKEINGDQAMDTDVQASYERTETSEMQIVNVEEMEREATDVDSNISYTSRSSSADMQVVPLIEYNCAEVGFPNISPLHTEETESSTVGSITRNGDILIYFDDIEEVKSSKTRDGDSQDQRIFKFKATAPKREKLESSCDLSYVDCYETWSENSSGSKTCRRSSRGIGKRPRKRSEESIRWHDNLKDTDCLSYYGSKHQKKSLVGEIETSYCAQKSLNMGAAILSCKCICNTNRLSCCCSLQHPRCFCTGNDNNMDCDVSPWKQKRGITSRVGFPNHGHEHCQQQHHYWNGQLNKGMEWGAVPREPMRRKSSGNEAMEYNVFTYPDDSTQKKVLKGIVEESKSVRTRRASISSTSPDVTSSWSTRKEVAAPPYFRAVTMPLERAKNNQNDDFQRSFSDTFSYPTHVHPKLPDYDDIATKFMALKKERLQKQTPLQQSESLA